MNGAASAEPHNYRVVGAEAVRPALPATGAAGRASEPAARMTATSPVRHRPLTIASFLRSLFRGGPESAAGRRP